MDLKIRLVFLMMGILIFLGQATASALWFKGKDVSVPRPSGVYAFDADLTKLIESPSASQSEVYAQAMELLESMQSAPSCNRIATSRLLKSCQLIEGPSANTEAAIEDVRAVYAAQLAICEVRSAGAQIPTHCDLILPTDEEIQPSFRNAPAGRELAQCLQSLESRPQWWTSYSNNKQNAVVMCRAARVDIEKDDLIRTFSSFVATSSNVNDALEKAVERENRQRSQQREFAVAVDSFQKQMLEDLTRSKAEASSIFTIFAQGIQSTLESLFNKISTRLGGIDIDIATFGEVWYTDIFSQLSIIIRLQNLRKSTVDTADLAKSIGKVFESAMRGSSDLASRQTEEWERSWGLANDLQGSLQSIGDQEVGVILMALKELYRIMQQLNNEMVTNANTRQDETNRKLATVSNTIEDLQKNTLASQALQINQMETQHRLHEELQRVAESTGERLAAIDASATSVGVKIQDIYSMLLPLIDLGRVAQTIGRWKWPVITVFLLFLVNRRLALSATVLLAGFFLLTDLLSSIPPDQFLVHYASGYQIPTGMMLRAFCVLSLLCSASINTLDL
ncbi:MAG: hypothetical protein MMC33_004176 [Icmadophila ericetorum]|nr:hypothetical protein [Icmadophila ericetorum]